MNYNLLDDNTLLQSLPATTRAAIETLWLQCDIAEKGGDPVDRVNHVRANLVRWAQSRSRLREYAQEPCLATGEYFCLSAIWADGWGDYFAMMQAASAIQHLIPTLDVYCLFQHKRPLPVIDLSDFGLDASRMYPFAETDTATSQVLEPVLSGQTTLPFEEEMDQLNVEIALDESAQQKREKRIQALDESIAESKERVAQLQKLQPIKQRAVELRKRLVDSKGILHLCLAMDTFTDPILRTKSMYYAESGNFQGIENAFKLNWYSMGLQSFEDGLFLRSDHTPVEPHYVAYFNRRIKSQLVFIYLVCLLHAGQDRTVKIMMPIEDLHALELDRDWLAAAKVKRVSIGFQVVEASHAGLTIDISNPFPLSIQDFRRYLGSSMPIVGCTGDGSLGDCLAAGRLPLYEMRPHKTGTLQGLLEQVRVIAPQAVGLQRYFDLQSQMLKEEVDAKEIASSLHKALTNQPWEPAWSEVIQEIHTHYNLEQNLIARVKHLVNRERSSQ